MHLFHTSVASSQHPKVLYKSLTFIHSLTHSDTNKCLNVQDAAHYCKSLRVKCLAQGLNNRLGGSRIWTAGFKPPVVEQLAVPTEPQLPISQKVITTLQYAY